MARKDLVISNKISAVIITRDSAKFIAESIKTLQWCDEVVVIDDFSVDDTVEVSKKLGAKVYCREMKGDFAAQRNYAYTVAKNDWLFFVDDDELSTDKLRDEIKTNLANKKNKKTSLYCMRRDDFFLGKLLKNGPAGNAYFQRLVKKQGTFWTDKIFEYVHVVDGEVVYLENRLVHRRQESISDLVVKANFYSDLESDMLFEKGVRSRLSDIFLDPISRFFNYYIGKKAILDGVPGFIFVVLGSVLVRFLGQVKLWAKWNAVANRD